MDYNQHTNRNESINEKSSDVEYFFFLSFLFSIFFRPADRTGEDLDIIFARLKVKHD